MQEIETLELEEKKEREELVLGTKPFEEITTLCKNAETISPFYVYAYLVDGEPVYIGKSKMGDKYQRGRSFGGHKHCIPDGISVDNIDVKIIGHYNTEEDMERTEAGYIHLFRLVEKEHGWNNKKEIMKNPFFKAMEANAGKRIDVTSKDLSKMRITNATGSSQTEPKELADHILKNVKIEGDVMLVGNIENGCFQMCRTLKDSADTSDVTNIDIICEENMGVSLIHDGFNKNKGFRLNINIGVKSYLDTTFEDTKKSIIRGYGLKHLIIQNSPWVTNKKEKEPGSREFNVRSMLSLKPFGKLIAIVSNNQFTDRDGKGTFKYMQKFGYFERIETFTGMSSRDYFYKYGNGAVGDWCWFIWQRGFKEKNELTTIVNKLGEEFKFLLKGNEKIIPQLPNEDDYFDWGPNGYDILRKTSSNSKSRTDGLYIISRTHDYTIHDIKKKDICPQTGFFIVGSNLSPVIFESMFEDIGRDILGEESKDKTKKDIIQIGYERFFKLYSSKLGGDLFRCPPIRKDIIEHLRKKKELGIANGA